jgi:hypothetical protein
MKSSSRLPRPALIDTGAAAAATVCLPTSMGHLKEREKQNTIVAAKLLTRFFVKL